MCCFSRPVRHVSRTQIFARGVGPRQYLVYSMSVAAAEDLAMILPLPVPPSPGDDAVEFIDLSGYPTLFSDLARGFPAMITRGGFAPQPAAPPAARAPLVVHDVGDFEASFVPTQADFDRLDSRFRLSPEVWAALPAYADFGFAVFKLRKSGGWLRSKAKPIHPMAFSFPRRDAAALFFPTVHVHDGTVPAHARFDHTLYAQPEHDVDTALEWEQSPQPAAAFVAVARTHGIVDGDRRCFRRMLGGEHPNADQRL